MRYAQISNHRRDFNRETNRLQVQVEGMEFTEGMPEEEVLVSDLVKELNERQEYNQANADKKIELDRIQNILNAKTETLKANEKRIEDISKQQEAAMIDAVDIEKLITEIVRDLREQKSLVDKLKDKECDSIHRLILNAEETNRCIRQNKAKADASVALKESIKKSEKQTDRLAKIKDEKLAMQAQAKWPVEDMAFGDDGLLHKGLPFSQASSAEQLAISVNMGLALNPKLPLLIIKDGDDKHLQTVATIAAKKGGQVFIERVGEGSECHIVLKDGKLKIEEEDKDESGSTDQDTSYARGEEAHA